jgi:hypothetical protein
VPNDTDRSRYLDGFNCRWRRLLGYHAFGTGITRKAWYPPLATGIYIHSALETVLRHATDTNSSVVSQAEVETLISPIIQDYRDTASRTGFVLSKLDEGEGYTASEMIEDQVALTEALTHGYARIVLPFVLSNFEVVAIEHEENKLLPLDVRYMARPDFTLRSRETGKLSTHDFKSSSYFADDQADNWADSIQMMVNASLTGERLGERIDEYYIHLLLKGSRKYPTCLTHPFFKPGIPPHVPDSWEPFGRIQTASGWRSVGRGYERTPVRKHRPVADWVWSMPEAACAKQFPLAGPYPIHHGKVEQFFRGVSTEEAWWQASLANIDWTQWEAPQFQKMLDQRFPRTFSCYTYGHRCPFYELCFKHPGWTHPLSDRYVTRNPHHPQEGEE